jgi:transcriptional regulator with XRE-family HTH domain
MSQVVQDKAEQLREAIRKSGLTLYRVAKDSRVNHASVHRFMHGRQVSLKSFDKLCDYLGLSLTKG